MAKYGPRGSTGWPLPPPPLVEGVDRRAHRQAKNWNARFQQQCEEQPFQYQIYHQDEEHFPLFAGQQDPGYSRELKTFLKTSPLRKWSQEIFQRENEETTSHGLEDGRAVGQLELEDDLDEPSHSARKTPNGEQDAACCVSITLAVDDGRSAVAPGVLFLEEQAQEGAGVDGNILEQAVESPQLSEQTSLQQSIFVSLDEGEEVLIVEVEEGDNEKTEWRRDPRQYLDKAFNPSEVSIVDDLDVEGKCGL